MIEIELGPLFCSSRRWILVKIVANVRDLLRREPLPLGLVEKAGQLLARRTRLCDEILGVLGEKHTRRVRLHHAQHLKVLRLRVRSRVVDLHNVSRAALLRLVMHLELGHTPQPNLTAVLFVQPVVWHAHHCCLRHPRVQHFANPRRSRLRMGPSSGSVLLEKLGADLRFRRRRRSGAKQPS